MRPKRYSLIIANWESGATHRLTVRLRSIAIVAVGVLLLPVLWMVYAQWSAQADQDRLTLRNAQLEIETAAYQAAANDLTIQITSLQAALSDLATRVDMDPLILRSIERLPEVTQAGALQLDSSGSEPPSQTFDVLASLLGVVDGSLQVVRQGVAYREALADATPVIWPAHGWISASYGYRPDPFTGERDFHPAVDISTREGQPVIATATGRIASASRNGAYGNLVEIDHGFNLTTRYGHLSEFAVAEGATVERGDVIGYAGATGRATGSHVHYEVWASGRTINPMRLLIEARPVAAN